MVSGSITWSRYGDAESHERKDAWFGHDASGPVQLAGLDGQRYVYTHCDGPFCSRTVSYVVEHRGRYLGLEFRTPDELDAVQQRIYESFRFE